MLQFETRSTRETYAGQTSDLSRLTCTAGAMPRNSSSSIQFGAAPHGAPIGRGVPIQEKTPHYSTSYDRELAAWVFIGLCAAMPFAICAVCFGIIKLLS